MTMKNVPTPWGRSQGGFLLAPGIKQYHTASHGGIKVNKRLNDTIPVGFRHRRGWYEENGSAVIPLYFFFDDIVGHMLTEGGWQTDEQFTREHYRARLEAYWIPECIYHFGTVYPPERMQEYGMEKLSVRLDQIRRAKYADFLGLHLQEVEGVT
jgi:hypothetical protein